MQGLNPKDIPLSGRYDFVCVKRQDPLFNEKLAMIHAIIDNGPFAGKRVSGRGDYFLGDRFSARLTTDTRTRIDGKMVEVPVDYEDGDVYVTYHLSDFEEPLLPATYHLRKRNKFRR